MPNKYPCEDILGSMKPVKEFAQFYVIHKDDIEKVKNYYLLRYCEGMEFTPKELQAFRDGLDCFPRLFENTEADTKSYLMEAEEKNNRKSVG